MAWVLCSKADVLSIHPTAEANLPDFWSEAVEQMIREHLSTPNLGLTRTYTDELYSGDGTPVLVIRRQPLLSVTSLVVDGAEIPALTCVVNKTTIQLIGDLVFPVGNLNVSVTYQSGGGVNPVSGLIDDPVIRLTAAAMVVAIANYRGRAGADSSIKWGGADQKEGTSTSNFDIGLTAHMRMVMKNMLRRSRLRIR
jgi:hypothetical protein